MQTQDITLSQRAGNQITSICENFGIYKAYNAVKHVFVTEHEEYTITFNAKAVSTEPAKDLALDDKKTNYWKIAAIVLAVVAVVALVVAAAFATAGFGIAPISLTMTQVIAGVAGSGAITLLSGAGAVYCAYRASKA
jgi:hypothetical protein